MSSSRGFDIPIDRHSRTATIAAWSAVSGGILVDAVDIQGVRELAFVPRQLLVDSRDTDLIAQVVDRFGSDVVEVVAEAPLLEPPPGMRPREDVDIDTRPQVSVLRFRELPEVSERGAALAAQRLGDRATVTSPDAARLLSLTSELPTTWTNEPIRHQWASTQRALR